MDALFGSAKYYETAGQYKDSRDCLAQLVVSMPGFTPPLIENIKVYLAEQDWEQTLESANR